MHCWLFSTSQMPTRDIYCLEFAGEKKGNRRSVFFCMSLSTSLSHKITVLIPCYNEEAGIASVIRSFPRERLEHHGFELEILVVDNDSRDATAEIALREGARVVHEPQRGKGNAIRLGFSHVRPDTDYVVMLDGDATYRPDEILRLIELLHSRFATVAIGSRLGGRIQPGAMQGLHRIGNWLFSHLIRQLYRVNVTDVLTGYFAWRREAVERLRPHLVSDGFAIEMEMITKMARLGEEIYCVPISYQPRCGNSSLRPVQDGARILWMLMRNLLWKPQAPARPTWQPRPLPGYASEGVSSQATPVTVHTREMAGVES